MAVPSNTLLPPTVQYSHRLSGTTDIDTEELKKGQWNLIGKRFITKAKVAHVHFLYPAKFNHAAFEKAFKEQLPQYLDLVPGSLITRDFVPAQYKDKADYADFEECLAACGPWREHYLIVFVNNYPGKEPYSRFREYADRELGVPSLCLKFGKLQSNREDRNTRTMAAQYFGNNAMKMNLRLGGGINHQIILKNYLPLGVSLDQTIIIGADVTHPGGKCSPGTGSLTALVGTVDLQCAIYRGVARPNPGREEVGVQPSATHPVLKLIKKNR